MAKYFARFLKVGQPVISYCCIAIQKDGPEVARTSPTAYPTRTHTHVHVHAHTPYPIFPCTQLFVPPMQVGYQNDQLLCHKDSSQQPPQTSSCEGQKISWKTQTLQFLFEASSYSLSCPNFSRTLRFLNLKLFPEKCVSVPIYLSLSARTDPHEHTILVEKAALIQETQAKKAFN